MGYEIEGGFDTVWIFVTKKLYIGYNNYYYVQKLTRTLGSKCPSFHQNNYVNDPVYYYY